MALSPLGITESGNGIGSWDKYSCPETSRVECNSRGTNDHRLRVPASFLLVGSARNRSCIPRLIIRPLKPGEVEGEARRGPLLGSGFL